MIESALAQKNIQVLRPDYDAEAGATAETSKSGKDEASDDDEEVDQVEKADDEEIEE